HLDAGQVAQLAHDRNEVFAPRRCPGAALELPKVLDRPAASAAPRTAPEQAFGIHVERGPGLGLVPGAAALELARQLAPVVRVVRIDRLGVDARVHLGLEEGDQVNLCWRDLDYRHVGPPGTGTGPLVADAVPIDGSGVAANITVRYSRFSCSQALT